MPHISVNSHKFTYSITYSKRRKTICLKIVGFYMLEIIVPVNLKNFDPARFITSKSGWLEAQMARLKTLEDSPINRPLGNSSLIPFLGKTYPLKIIRTTTSKCSVTLSEQEILVQFPQAASEDHLSAVLEAWYRKLAADILKDKTAFWSSQLNVTPQKISIKDQKTRWGSCSSLGNINYNWRIVMAPPEIIDYLIIHELSHLIEPNHSQKFWAIVQRYCSNFKQSRNWLKMNGRLLMGFLK